MPKGTRKYFLGPNLLSDIRDVIAKSDSLPPKRCCVTDVYKPPYDQQDGPAVRSGTVPERWAKDTTATVTWMPGGTVTATMVATNLFRNVPPGDVMVGRAGYTWYLLEATEDPPFRVATFSGDSSGGWAKGSTTTITFNEPLPSGETTATAANYFCSVGGGNVGVSRDEDSKWHLVTWEMDQVCDQKIEDITLQLNTATCAIMKTIHTATVQYMQMTYPYIDCSVEP